MRIQVEYKESNTIPKYFLHYYHALVFNTVFGMSVCIQINLFLALTNEILRVKKW